MLFNYILSSMVYKFFLSGKDREEFWPLAIYIDLSHILSDPDIFLIRSQTIQKTSLNLFRTYQYVFGSNEV